MIGSALIPGAAAPKLVTREMISNMRPGSVLVDIAIDQGGCFESSRPTSHADPVYTECDIVHYAVTNMPGAVPRTATLALSNVTMPHIRSLAGLGWREALERGPPLAKRPAGMRRRDSASGGRRRHGESWRRGLTRGQTSNRALPAATARIPPPSPGRDGRRACCTCRSCLRGRHIRRSCLR